ncbi:hypothetical protein INT47_005455 [Mucor saturninus]|uniref:Uncharacterized protein n=1 Tax=Mucor saturninus TaxID=64648 RepID=A0A8H7REH0_9FUNG|nr:hypothetical protein INT47_005455 [Mucor saturninus]
MFIQSPVVGLVSLFFLLLVTLSAEVEAKYACCLIPTEYGYRSYCFNNPCLVRQIYLGVIRAHLDEQFGVEAVYVMGNWSAPNTRFHEPIRGLKFQQVSATQPVNVEILKRFGWSVTSALIDEEQILVLLDMVSKGIYTNQNCRAMTDSTNRIVPRLWNCDTIACLNMVDIVRALLSGNGIFPRFRRGEVPQDQRRRIKTQNDLADIRNVRQRRN